MRHRYGDDLINELDSVAAVRGYPAVLRCDNGPELACVAMADWARERVGLHLIPPGEPWRNGYVESFNSGIPDECLNVRRRHSSLGYQTPVAFAAARANDRRLSGHSDIPPGGPRSQAVSHARLRT